LVQEWLYAAGPLCCGVGFKFDFIIVHESAHEWFGNNISMKDAADMWIHEGFANYAENLFVEYHFGKKDAEDYVVGTRRGIRNDRPIIGTYRSNREGSGDMYPKGGNMLHTIRHVINDDAKWLSILRGLSADFWHQTVTTEQIESYISSKGRYRSQQGI
jgi:aminopeptidase N